MLGEALKKRLDQRPFEPFRFHITNGERIEIRHPELAFLTRATIVVGQGGRAGVADYALEYSLIHIVKIEPAGAGRQPSTNGKGQPRRPRRK